MKLDDGVPRGQKLGSWRHGYRRAISVNCLGISMDKNATLRRLRFGFESRLGYNENHRLVNGSSSVLILLCDWFLFRSQKSKD